MFTWESSHPMWDVHKTIDSNTVTIDVIHTHFAHVTTQILYVYIYIYIYM